MYQTIVRDCDHQENSYFALRMIGKLAYNVGLPASSVAQKSNKGSHFNCYNKENLLYITLTKHSLE